MSTRLNAARREPDRPILGRELNCVIDKIGARLLDQRGIAVDLQPLWMCNRQGNALFFGDGAIQIGDAFESRHDIDAPE